METIKVRQTVSIEYDGGTNGRSSRQVTPKSLAENRGLMYLVAHCHIDGVEKGVRLDRILEIG